MKIFTLLLTFLVASFSLSAQYTWDAGGDGTSWDDAMNWDRDEVPMADSAVIFATSATITGTAPNNPVSVRVAGNVDLVLDLDLTVGNGTDVEHAITFGDTSSLTFGAAGTPRTLTTRTERTRHNMAIFGGSEMVTVTIGAGSVFDMQSGTSGINLANGNSTFINNGTILCREGLRDGFRVSGTFINNATITGEAIGRDLFTVKDGGSVVNAMGGLITSDRAGDDAFDLSTEASLTNDGTLSLTAPDNAGSANTAISVGDDSSPATFINNNEVMLDGGTGDDPTDLAGRALTVDTLGTVTNNGTITIAGGAENNRLFVRGVYTNGMDATLDLLDGRFNVNEFGLLTNNGLIKSTRDGSGGFVNGTAVNNAFYDYANSNSFASGNGMTTENGFSLNNNDTRVNARNACTVDLANAPYEWFINGESYAMASDTGAFTFAANTLTTDSVVLTTTLPGVEIKVINICQEALMTSGVFSPAATAEAVRVYPNPVSRGGVVTLDLSGYDRTPISFRVVHVSGRVVRQFEVRGGGSVALPIQDLVAGSYMVSGTAGRNLLMARLMITE